MFEKEVLSQTVIENSKMIEDIVYSIVKSFTAPLDIIMDVSRKIFMSGNPMTDLELEDLLLQLPSTLYFIGEGQEVVGIREDVAKMIKLEKYNEVRKKITGTVADKNTEAENASLNEAINQIIYQRAYKMIKSKIEMGYEMINSLKRVNDRRRAEAQLSLIGSQRVGGK